MSIFGTHALPDPQHDPAGWAGLLLDEDTPYWVATTYQGDRPLGHWEGWAPDEATALAEAWTVARRAMRNAGQLTAITRIDVRAVSPGEAAGLFTGARRARPTQETPE